RSRKAVAPALSPFFSSTAALVRSVVTVLPYSSALSAYFSAVSTSPLRSSHRAAAAHALGSQCLPPRSVLRIDARTVAGRSTPILNGTRSFSQRSDAVPAL